MIIGADTPRELWRVYRGLTDSDGRHYREQPYRVIRVASRDEYLDANREALQLYGDDAVVPSDAFFYEIAID